MVRMAAQGSCVVRRAAQGHAQRKVHIALLNNSSKVRDDG